jgi:hypothetical protein
VHTYLSEETVKHGVFENKRKDRFFKFFRIMNNERKPILGPRYNTLELFAFFQYIHQLYGKLNRFTDGSNEFNFVGVLCWIKPAFDHGPDGMTQVLA